MMYCSYNGITLNPKMKLQHYADKIGNLCELSKDILKN